MVEQKRNMPSTMAVLRRMRDDAYKLFSLCLGPNIDLEQLGKSLHRGWDLKRSLASKISTSDIDDYYEAAIRAGAEGGKLCGAGGGGFLMFVVKPQNRKNVREVLRALPLVHVGYEVHGSRVLYPVG